MLFSICECGASYLHSAEQLTAEGSHRTSMTFEQPRECVCVRRACVRRVCAPGRRAHALGLLCEAFSL